MAWLLAGGALLAGGSYVLSEVSDFYDEKTKPLYDYFEKSKMDEIEREKENKRQEQINDIKKKKIYHDELRTRYDIKGSGFIKMVNNMEDVCSIIFVNHYQAKNEEEALAWAKKVNDISYVELGLFNKLNTKKEVIGVNGYLDMIPKEFEDYYVVVCVNDKYKILNKPENKQINLKKLYNQTEEHTNDTQCKWFF